MSSSEATDMTTPEEPDGKISEVKESLEETTTKEEIGVRQAFVDFCRQTILHGWHYLVEYEDSGDSQEELDDIACPSKASPKENSFEGKRYYSGKCFCHRMSSNSHLRNRGSRHNTSRTRNLTRKRYRNHQHSQCNVPKEEPEEFRDHTVSSRYEKNGKYYEMRMHFS